MPALAPVMMTTMSAICLATRHSVRAAASLSYCRSMFTGIVERSVRIASIAEGTGFRRLTIAAPWTDVGRGESIAINGVCLTAAEIEQQQAQSLIAFDVIP